MLRLNSDLWDVNTVEECLQDIVKERRISFTLMYQSSFQKKELVAGCQLSRKSV